MNTATWKRLTAHLLTDGWRTANRLVYLHPVHWVVHGLLPEGSAQEPSTFYLWLVRMPLCVPSEVIDLSWSERFGGSSTRFELSDSAQSSISEAAAKVEEQRDSAQVLLDPPGGADNVRMQEARAYGLLIEGHDDAAVEVLGRVLRYEPKYAWEEELVARSNRMKQLLVEGKRADAISALEAWRHRTMAALGLT